MLKSENGIELLAKYRKGKFESFLTEIKEDDVMIIQHNLQAINANRQLNITGGRLAKSSRNLSSGYKINIAADDAAGLSISEKMRKQVRGLTQASVNSEDGISMVQIADGALAEVHDMLDRCIELSVKAANGTLSYSDRTDIQNEIDQIVKEIDAIKERTKFNEVYVLKGDVTYTQKETETVKAQDGSLPIWVKSPSTASISAGDKSILSETYTSIYEYTKTIGTVVTTATIAVNHAAASLDFSDFDTNPTQKRKDLIGMGFNTTCCTCDNFYSIEFTHGNSVEQEIDGMLGTYVYKIGIDNINTAADLVQKIVDVTKGNPGGHYTNLEADVANSGKLWVYDHRGKDAMPSALGTGTVTWKNWTGIGANSWDCEPNPNWNSGLFGTGVIRSKKIYKDDERIENPHQLALQVGSETANFMYLRLATISSQALGIDKIDVRGVIYENKTEQDEYGVEYTVQVQRMIGAEQAIRAFSAAKDLVSADRSRLGAYQNRLEHTVSNLDNVVENTTAAESLIRDTDMAEEMVKYSNNNILLQAGQSMLTQANQSRQGILSLLAA